MSEWKPYLYHHGVKGMHWGVRRYQNANGTYTEEGKERRRTGHRRSTTPDDVINKMRDRRVGDAADNAVAFATVAVVLSQALMPFGIALYAKHAVKKQMAHEEDLLDHAKDSSEYKHVKDVPKLSKPMSAKESMKVTNPDYPKDGHTMNCTYCTAAMAMREKGYDVKAMARPTPTWSEMVFRKGFNSTHQAMDKHTTRETFKTQLESQGDGAYGAIDVQWKLGGGHSIFYKNVNGKCHVYDGQTGTEYTSDVVTWDNFISNVNLKHVGYNRLDNCEPTDYVLGFVEASDNVVKKRK